MTETKKQTVAEMREQLLNEGINPEIVESASKKQLRELLEQKEKVEAVEEFETLFQNVEIPTKVDGKLKEENVIEVVIPSPTDIGWTDYVLTLFDSKEIDQGNPKVDGLRRVAELLLGEFNVRSEVIDCPRIENGYSAVVTITLEFDSGRIVQASADTSSRNTESTFARHSVASSETRAEGRALRKALRLTKVLSAEELQNANIDEPDGKDRRIPTGMITGLKLMCQRLSIDLLQTAKFSGFDVQAVEDLTDRQGLEISNKISQFDNGKIEIPQNLKV